MAQHSNPPNSVVLRIPRSEIKHGDVILGPAPRDLPIARRPRLDRRASSLDRDDFRVSRNDTGARVTRYRQEQDPYESEASIAPRARPRAPGRRGQRRTTERSSSPSSSSDLGSTTDDEKQKHKAKLKKWGSIALAGVATIHMVHGVHETVEKARERRQELAEGDISGSEAERRKRKARWKNAANVGIAAVWVKSAVDEIKEYREAKHEHVELIEKAEERHRKRVERDRAIMSGQYRQRYPPLDYER